MSDNETTPLVVALVNNMPDPAVQSTDRQFRELLHDAAAARPVSLRIFSRQSPAREGVVQDYVRQHHAPLTELWGSAPDALIVTGTEPKSADTTEEPSWPILTRLVDWASERALPTVWSCLAAHAAVRYLDGVERQRRPAKLSGVFESVAREPHPLPGEGAGRWLTPHSRHNELSGEKLLARGYRLLGCSPQAGAEMFVKEGRSLFLFLQGHPEYDTCALLREYRRDVGRFLCGQHDAYPELPHGYFDNAATEVLSAFRERAMRERTPATLLAFPMAAARENLRNTWRPAAIRLYRNWLAHVAAPKMGRPAELAADAPAAVVLSAAHG